MPREVRLAVRRLAREPALAGASIATLALGIGVCTAMFSIVEAVLLKPMDVAQPQRVVVLWPQFGDTAGEFTYTAYRELARPSASFERVALTGSANWPIPTDIVLPDGRRVRGTQCAVSDTFFDTLGARPLLGRTFDAGEDRPGAPLSLVVSSAFWKTRLGGDPGAVGQTLAIGRDRWRIVGVMPPEFFYPSGADLWTPAATLLALTSGDQSPGGVQQIFDTVGAFHVVARLRPGVSLGQARAFATGRWKAIPRAPVDASASVAVTPFVDHVFGSARRALWLLLGAVAFVLVIACANVAGLLLARNALRARELSVRRALGAGAWHLARQHLVEAALLAGTGGLLGIAITASVLRTLIALSPATVVRLSDTRVDAMVLAAFLAITAAVTVGVGLIPALQSRPSSIVNSMNALSMREPGRGVRSDTRRVLVIGQVAITVILLAASALTAQSFMRLAALDLGFDPADVVTLDLGRLDWSRYATYAARHQVVDELVNNLERIAGVQSAAAVLNQPFAHGVIGWDSGVLREGQPDLDATWLAGPIANFEVVTPHYFQSMGIPLRAGRSISPADRANTPLVVVISDNLAARMWPGQDPIGKRLLESFGRGRNGRPSAWRTVVGVVGAARYRELDRTRFDLYVPLAQVDDFDPEHIVVKTAGNARAVIPPAAALLSRVDPMLTASDLTTMDEVMRQVRAPWRFNMLLFAAFGCMSIALIVIGIAGLVVSTVNWRRREIGVRLALGAQAHEVVTLIAAHGARLIAAGVGLGVLASVLTLRLLSSLLFGVAANDVPTLISVAAGVLVFGTLTCYWPARRAASLDPSSIFRDQ